MITKRVSGRKDGRTSAADALRYGQGLKRDKETGNYLEKSYRTRFANFGLVDDGVYDNPNIEEMAELIELASTEMQANCDLNTRVGPDKKIAHFIVSFNQAKPSDAVLRDTEDSMLSALKLGNNHFATFLHNDNGYWHVHIFASRIDKMKHLGNPLWQDWTIRDRVCKEIELRHGLERDNGLHRIDEDGRIVEVPRAERRKRQELKSIVTDKARSIEIHSGEQTFQSWAEEIRIGDRLKHAKSWQDIHAAAAAYGCEIRPKGAGFIICPNGEKGGIQLSKVGLKNLPARFGAFQPPNQGTRKVNLVAAYKPEPTLEKGASHYSKWQDTKKAFQPVKTALLNELSEKHVKIRRELKVLHRNELGDIRARTAGEERFAAVSVAKMQQAIQLSSLSGRFKQERQALYKDLGAQGPGNTYREFLVREASKGDNAALQLARKYGMDQATKVSREREEGYLRIKAVIVGHEYLPAPRLPFTHHIGPSGTVVYELGHDRQIVDSAVARQIQLNDVAALDPEAIETALRFATLKFGSTLTLTGPAEFQKLAVETAVRERLGITFTDPTLEAYRQKLVDQQNSFSIQRSKETHYASNHRVEHLRQIPPAQIRNRLRALSLGDLVLDTERDVMSLRQDVPYRVGQHEERGDYPVQRSAGRSEGVSRSNAASSSAGREPASTDTINNQGLVAGHSKPKSSRSQRKDIPVVPAAESIQFAQVTQEVKRAAEQSASEWANEAALKRRKDIVEPRPGNGSVTFEVIHVGVDGIVLDLGRSIAVYPKTASLDIRVGARVAVGKDMQILLLQKSRDDELGR